jgi:uncharacterized membrane protein HdeD (DUF308 family)
MATMQKGNVIILVLGVLVIAAGVLINMNYSSFIKSASLTEGTVVHVSGSSYKIQYTTDDGIEKIHQGSQRNHKYREGNTISLWYKIDNPDVIRLSDFKKGFNKFLIAGIACILLGVYPLFMKKKAADKAD